MSFLRSIRRGGWVGVALVVGGAAALLFPALTLGLSWSGPTELTGVSQTALRAVTCISTSQCVTVGDLGEEAAFNPANIAGLSAKPLSFTGLTSAPTLEAVACPSSTQCTAVGSQGDIVTFNPATGATVVNNNIESPSDGGFYDVACPSTGVCVAGDTGGYMFKFDPVTGQNLTTKVLFDTDGDQFNGIACDPTGALCTAVNQVGIEYSFNPSAPTLAHTTATLTSNSDALEQIACPSTTQCVAGDQSNGSAQTFNPSATTPASTLQATPLESGSQLFGMSCVSATFCATSDGGSKVFEGAAGAASWSTDTVPGQPSGIDSIACPATTLCVSVDTGGNLYVGATATTTTTTTTTTKPPPPSEKAGVATTKLPNAHGSSVSAKVTCKGQSACEVTAELTGIEDLSRHGKVQAVIARKRRTKKPVTLGLTRKSIPAGETLTVTVSLNGHGNGLVSRLHHIGARYTLSQGHKTLFTGTLKFKAGRRESASS